MDRIASQPQTHNIVIVGGSFGGLSAAHNLLQRVIKNLSTKQLYKVIMIAPNSQFYWKVGAPRQIANPDRLPQERVFLDIGPGFERYGSQFEHIKAYAVSIDESSQLISYRVPSHDHISGTLHYDALVLASGTIFKDPIWSVQLGEDETKRALTSIHSLLPIAKTIVVAGGGASGIETAGELGWRYGQSKNITLITGGSKLLSRLRDPRLGKDAESMLQRLGVTIRYNLKVETAPNQPGKKTILKLSDGSEEAVDVFLDATGEAPNNSFIPREWLTEDGYVKTSTHTLRIDIPSVRKVYAIGSIASYSDGSVASVLFACKALCESIRIDLAGEADGPHRKAIYKPLGNDMQIIPVGPNQGVATAFGWKFPSWLVSLYKGRDFNSSLAQGIVMGRTF